METTITNFALATHIETLHQAAVGTHEGLVLACVQLEAGQFDEAINADPKLADTFAAASSALIEAAAACAVLSRGVAERLAQLRAMASSTSTLN